MTSVTLEEKRLRLLKQQLFGKEKPVSLPLSNFKSKNSSDYYHQTQITATVVDIISMKRDLTKIVVFSIVALAIQLSLFFASKQGFINLFR